MSVDELWNAIKRRTSLILSSWKALPLWVEVWVMWLCVANFLCVFGTSHQAQAIGICGLFILISNSIVVIVWAGFTKLMSFFHIIGWGPLLIYLLASLILPAFGIWSSQEIPIWSFDWFLTIVIIITNGISLVFDVMDCIKYLKGDHSVPGHEQPIPEYSYIQDAENQPII